MKRVANVALVMVSLFFTIPLFAMEALPESKELCRRIHRVGTSDDVDLPDLVDRIKKADSERVYLHVLDMVGERGSRPSLKTKKCLLTPATEPKQ